jgi:aminoglycoside phosphotransferase (APT) family kinase protein
MTSYLDQDFSREQIESMIGAHHPWRVASFERIRTGKYNVSYDVHLYPNGHSGQPPAVILRIAPPAQTGGTFYEIGMMAQEPKVHEIVRRETHLPIAEIYSYDSSHSVVDRDFVIMQKLPGTALSEIRGLTVPLYDHVLEQVGRMLAELHHVTSDHYGYFGEHHCMTPQPDWPRAFHVMWNRLADDIVAAGGYDEQESAKVRLLYDKFTDAFDPEVEASLLHMDIWAQNILTDATGTVTGLVDWDRALWGDPEIEFAVLDYCGLAQPAFWRGYGRKRDSSPEAAVRGLFYYLYEIQKYIVIHLTRGQPHTASIYKARTMDVVERGFR